MSDNASTSATSQQGGFRLTMMYHPSHHVPDLDEAAAFFDRVFERPTTPMAAMYKGSPPTNDYPREYSAFTPISDVLMDTIDPQKYVLLGVQRYPSVEEPHLKGFGWYVDNIADAYRSIKRHGFTLISQLDEVAEGDDPPGSAGSPMPLFFTVPADAGMRYEFLPPIPFPLDPRIEPGWVVPPVSDDDPLGIEFCSHHTVLTGQPERALRLIVDALGGTVVHEGRDEVFGATGTYVRLSDSILEYAVPDEGTLAHDDWSTVAPNDVYHSITWKVVDLDRVERHLDAQGVKIRTRTDDTIVTDPSTSLGIPWGFTTTLTPGDPRLAG
jgi:hypothetical protein